MKWHYYNPKFEYKHKLKFEESAWSGHEYFVYDLIRQIKPSVIVELGTDRGHSFFSMCQAVKDGDLKTILSAIDTWKGDKHARYYDESVYQGIQKLAKEFYSDVDISLIRKTFDEGIKEFEDGSIDLLHIDGLHTYDAVKHDFDNWLKKVNKKGIILFHDTHEKRDDFGVYKLWAELKKRYKTIEFPYSHGLGIVIMDEKLGKEMMGMQQEWQLLYSSREEKDNLSFQIEKQRKESNKALKMKDYNIEDLAKVVYKKEKNIKDLSTEVENLSKEIASMKDSRFWKLRDAYVKTKDVVAWKKRRK